MMCSISLTRILSNSAALDSDISFSARALKQRRTKRLGLSLRLSGHGSLRLQLRPMPRNMRCIVDSVMIPRSRIRMTKAAALMPNIFLISMSSVKPKLCRRRPTSRMSSSRGAKKAPAKRWQAFSSCTVEGMSKTMWPNS